MPGAPLFPSERRRLDGPGARVSTDVVRRGLTDAVAPHLPGWAGRLTPHVLRHYCASQLYQAGVDIIAVQELLGHSWISTTMRYVHVHATRIEDAVHRQPGARCAAVGRIARMKWNLRLAAANRGVWKASELRRMLAERGVQMSVGKMSGLWSGQPAVLRPDELDAFCAVLGCEISDLITAEPEKAPAPRSRAQNTAVTLRSGSRAARRARPGRSPRGRAQAVPCPHDDRDDPGATMTRG